MTATMVDAVIIHIYGSFLSVFLCCESSDFGGGRGGGIQRTSTQMSSAKSQDDARRERLTQARAPGRPVLPFGDVEGSNLRTRDGAV